MSKLNKSSSELDLDRPNIEDYLPSGSIQEPHGKLRLRDLLDISPTLMEAAGAIVDVFVCNHTSMIDFIILEQMTAFAIIMQKHPGWVGNPSQCILQLMTSWAVVCDVWYLEPQSLKPGETAIEFAESSAGLKMVPWDGYLKYSRPSTKHRESKQQSFAESVLRRLEEK
ncbi:Glycerol-3-phosphate acyltransferase 9 [Camellia lanceoleosa]|uniref:Glycerol-3-phosphate acyltransferase 9 n=1 Tax=Camellia lanceoleosa TaxID=1840588 RepID=A0ACC0IDF7_9ERIC|nr:Glycerol-3-phosphate acyltransferase 9 [Camellia lanceoleosa]